MSVLPATPEIRTFETCLPKNMRKIWQETYALEPKKHPFSQQKILLGEGPAAAKHFIGLPPGMIFPHLPRFMSSPE